MHVTGVGEGARSHVACVAQFTAAPSLLLTHAKALDGTAAPGLPWASSMNRGKHSTQIARPALEKDVVFPSVTSSQELGSSAKIRFFQSVCGIFFHTSQSPTNARVSKVDLGPRREFRGATRETLLLT